MTLFLRSIADAGEYGKERLVMKASEDLDIGDYVLLQVGTVRQGVISTKTRHSFWFPYKKILKDDLVVLYTKQGASSEKDLDGGNTTHFYYWGLKDAIWTDSKLNAVLLHAPSWKSKSVADLAI